jgi:hypothetical protein
MAHWMLAPIDHRAEIWGTYPVQRIVVEAQGRGGGSPRRRPQAAQPNPGSYPALTSCEEVDPGATTSAR